MEAEVCKSSIHQKAKETLEKIVKLTGNLIKDSTEVYELYEYINHQEGKEDLNKTENANAIASLQRDKVDLQEHIYILVKEVWTLKKELEGKHKIKNGS